MFMPQFMIIMLQTLKAKNRNIDFPIESLSYTSTALTAVSFNNFFNIRNRTTSTAFIWLYFLGMAILILSSLNTVILYEAKQANSVLRDTYNNQTITIITFILSLIFFLFADFFFNRLNTSSRFISFQIDEEHKININGLAKAFVSFIKSSPKLLIISILVTISLNIVFHYERNIVNHLGVLGGVIAIFTLFDTKGKK